MTVSMSFQFFSMEDMFEITHWIRHKTIGAWVGNELVKDPMNPYAWPRGYNATFEQLGFIGDVTFEHDDDAIMFKLLFADRIKILSQSGVDDETT